MSRHARHAAAILAALLTLLLVAAPAAAHAELTASDPADGSEVAGPFEGPITLSFSESLGENSRAELLDDQGDAIADASFDATQPDQLTIELDAPLAAGDYRIEIVAAGADGHIERPVVEFTVLEPEPTTPPAPSPTAAPSSSAAPSAAPSASPAPTPTPSADGTPTAGSSDVLIPILAAVIAVAVLGFVLLRNRRNRPA
jgi:methionine-rich copper-binding protein CopC